MSAVRHIPVMGETVVEMLLAARGGLFVDATVGTGGHADLILRAAPVEAELIGIDRDPGAIEASSKALERYGARVTLIRGNFRDLGSFLGSRKGDGFLLDLGVSSYQLSDARRGFSYLNDGPLDMAMGPGSRSVRELLRSAEEQEIGRIIREYGEERRWRAIAREIVKRRCEREMETTLQLRESVVTAAPGPDAIGTLSRVFQAFRMWANEEMQSLAAALPLAVEYCNPRGRIVVISYHSLEDRIVKRFFRQEERGCICPPDFPECRCGRAPRLTVITRSPMRPASKEVEANPRSRSAKLRAAERL